MSKPIMERYDVTISPDSNPLIQKTIEVDAGDIDSAFDYVLKLTRYRVHIVSIRAHKECKARKQGMTMLVRLKGCLRFW